MASKKKVKKTRLTRSKKEKIIFGVVGGLAEKYDVDPTLLQIVWIVILAFTGFVPGIVVYFVAALVMPNVK